MPASKKAGAVDLSRSFPSRFVPHHPRAIPRSTTLYFPSALILTFRYATTP